MKNIITISRQFGSGGREIADKLAQELGYKVYDKQIICKIAQRTGFAEKFITNACENASTSSSFFFALEKNAFSRFGNKLSLYDEIYKTMREVVEETSAEGNCIIIGKASDFILKDNEYAAHVYIYANDEFRISRTQLSSSELREKDEKRKVFYFNYTDRNWGDNMNYTLCLNSGELGIENCVKIIKSIIK